MSLRERGRIVSLDRVSETAGVSEMLLPRMIVRSIVGVMLASSVGLRIKERRRVAVSATDWLSVRLLVTTRTLAKESVKLDVSDASRNMLSTLAVVSEELTVSDALLAMAVSLDKASPIVEASVTALI